MDDRRRAERCGDERGRGARRPSSRLTLAAPLALAAALLAGCGLGDAHEPPATVRDLRLQALRDSAAGDSAALATLPPALQAVLRLEPYLTDRHIAATPDAECRTLGDSLPDVLVAERRRVRLRLPDSSAVVLVTRADRESATLRRIEVVRRLDDEQHGFIWRDDGDQTIEVRWPEGPFGRMETAPQPRGGPVPRALRALGRRVLVLTCGDAGSDESLESGEVGAGR